MIELTDRQVAEFWHRSYSSVDGLWFMKVEEKYGFDTALDVDDEVWKVLPKMQARTLKSMAGCGNGIDALFQCLATKLNLEGFGFEAKKDAGGQGFAVTIRRCPWHDLMVKSNRASLSGKVGTRICNTEYSVWASEFGGDTRFELGDQICEGRESCVLRFHAV